MDGAIIPWTLVECQTLVLPTWYQSAQHYKITMSLNSQRGHTLRSVYMAHAGLFVMMSSHQDRSLRYSP